MDASAVATSSSTAALTALRPISAAALCVAAVRAEVTDMAAHAVCRCQAGISMGSTRYNPSWRLWATSDRNLPAGRGWRPDPWDPWWRW